MVSIFRRTVGFILIFCLLLISVQAVNPPTVDQLITWQNTGNQRKDIVEIALTQVGYEEKSVNDTFYGDWYQLPGQEWCAMFVSWCARQAEVSEDILYPTAWAHPNSFKISCYPGTEYTPQPGDLFFTENFTHVGIVWYVEGEFFYCIEGNARYHDYTLPPDPSIDSYHVMTNKRLISAHSFGVPAYEGCDKEHSYVRGHDTSHPHRAYYECSTCGDKYYTGYKDTVSGCSSCFSCGCNAEKAGYYQLQYDDEYLRLRKTHDWGNPMPNYVTPGSVLYVYGISRDGWAYVEYYGLKGHIPAEYLVPYDSEAPASPTVTTAKTQWYSNESIALTWDSVEKAEQYRLDLYRDGALYQQLRFTDTSCTLTLPGGDFEARLTACNRVGQSACSQVAFSVRDTYYVNYQLGGGTNGPATQTQSLGQTLLLSTIEPSRQGYRFLGWTDVPDGQFVRYKAGDPMIITGDATLYAVWKNDNAEATSLTIRQGMDKTLYLLGDQLDTTGLLLDIFYSDGTGYSLDTGFTTQGFDPQTVGQQTITITCEGLTVTCQVQVIETVPGDLNNDRLVDRDDVMALLWHINFPEQFEILGNADFNRDGQVDRDDVMALLWHINFPEQFPLEQPNEEGS